MTKEVLIQKYPFRDAKKATCWEETDMVSLERSFRQEWGDHRSAHVIVTNDDGSKTAYETYRIPIPEKRDEIEGTLVPFLTLASVLGFTPAMGPVVIPHMKKMGEPTWTTWVRPECIVCLKREMPLGE